MSRSFSPWTWWKLDERTIPWRPGPFLDQLFYLPDINYAALSHLQWQSVGINKSNLPTQPPATEKPFVYLWIHLHTETFNWEDDSKINIPQPPPPNDTRHNSTPASHLSIPLWRLNMEKEKSQIAHERESNIPLGRLLHPFRFNINILFVFFLLACRASLMKAAPSSPSIPRPCRAHLQTLFADEISSLDRFSFRGITLSCQLLVSPNCRLLWNNTNEYCCDEVFFLI